MIVCNKCGESKSPEDYYKQPRNKSGLMGHCRLCENKRKQQNDLKHKAANPDAWNERRRGYVRAYKERHPDRIKQQNRKQNLKKMGITEEHFNQLLLKQEHKCAICLKEQEDRNFAIDHDHKCCPGRKSCGNCIRGLLCANCNTALGLLKENQQTITRLLEYVNWKS